MFGGVYAFLFPPELAAALAQEKPADRRLWIKPCRFLKRTKRSPKMPLRSFCDAEVEMRYRQLGLDC